MLLNTEEIRLWLKGRPLEYLRVTSNPLKRTFGFADLSTSEYAICSLTNIRRDTSLLKKYNKIQNKSDAANDGAMIKAWLMMI